MKKLHLQKALEFYVNYCLTFLGMTDDWIASITSSDRFSNIYCFILIWLNDSLVQVEQCLPCNPLHFVYLPVSK